MNGRSGSELGSGESPFSSESESSLSGMMTWFFFVEMLLRAMYLADSLPERDF